MTGDKSNKFFCFPLKNRKSIQESPNSDPQYSETDELFQSDPLDDDLASEKLISDNLDLLNSYVDGCFMPPWDHVIEFKPDGEYQYLNDFINVDELWEDPTGMLELNTSQKSRFFCWIRYFNLCSNLRFFNGFPSSDRILQGYVGDCSTVSSLSSLAEYEKLTKHPVLRDKIKLVDLDSTAINLRNLVYPEEYVNYFGDYKIGIGVKIHFNGCARCMLVDDWVPIRKERKPLCAHSSDPNELWVTLFEKASVRLIGKSYSIKGTNPGVDIYHLTGWIPEIIQLPPFQYKKPNPDRPENNINFKGSKEIEGNDLSNMEKWDGIWSSLVYNFNRNLVVCLGTNDLYDVTTDPNYIEGISVSSGIVSGHAYSVLNLVEVEVRGEKYRLMLLKNPWRKISSKLKIPEEVFRRLPSHNDSTKETDDGIFWIEWVEVLKWFSHLYVCWTDKSFEFVDKINFTWSKSRYFLDSWVPEDSYLSLFNPQICVSTEKDTDVIKNLENVSVSENEGDDLVIYAMLIQNRAKLSSKMKYLAIHTFEGTSRVITPNDPLVNGVYSNSEVILTKLSVSGQNNANGEKIDIIKRYGKHYSVVSHYGSKKLILLICHFMKKIQDDKCFTLVVYSNKMVKLQLVPSISSKYNNKVFEYKWTNFTGGMNPNQIWSYFGNPHFRLEISEGTNMILLLETDAEISVNLRLFFGRLATVKALKTRQAMSSNEYKLYCCSIQDYFNKGIYTLIPSNFNGIPAKFRFNVFFESGGEDNVKIYPIPYPHINFDLLPNYLSLNGTSPSAKQNLVDGEYKINADDEKMLIDKDFKHDSGLIDTSIKQFVIQRYYRILMTKMVNYYFDFKVKESCLLSIRIKVNSLNDFKYVLFARDSVDRRNLDSECVKCVKQFTSNSNDNHTDSGVDDEERDALERCGKDDRNYTNDMGEPNSWSDFCSNVCCIDCGGPCGRFYPINVNLFDSEYKLGYRYCVFSDLNGGISKNGRTPSNSSHVLFVKDRLVLFTLVELFPGVDYRLVSMGQFTFQDLTLISNRPIVPL